MIDLRYQRKEILRFLLMLEVRVSQAPGNGVARLAAILISECAIEEIRQTQHIIDCLYPGARGSNPRFERRFIGLSLADMALLSCQNRMVKAGNNVPDHIAAIHRDLEGISSIPAEELRDVTVPAELAWFSRVQASGPTAIKTVKVTTDPLPAELQRYSDSECRICFETPEPGKDLTILPCEHWFCDDCVWPWLWENNPTCPVCRRDIWDPTRE
jgi:hypothetical protein